MQRTFILSAIALLALSACDSDVADQAARDVALQRVTVLSDELVGPGIASDVAAECVVENASLQELVILAGPSQDAARAQAAEIVARPEVISCMATGVLQG